MFPPSVSLGASALLDVQHHIARPQNQLRVGRHRFIKGSNVEVLQDLGNDHLLLVLCKSLTNAVAGTVGIKQRKRGDKKGK